MSDFTIVSIILLYIGLLFLIAYYGDRAAVAGKSLINNPFVYALSIAVYTTSWTFYGSVGLASVNGLSFLPIYIGPILMFLFGMPLLRKLVHISKSQNTTTIADFIAARYGKSQAIAGLVTVIAVIGILPYISLQLKAISNSLSILRNYPDYEAIQTVSDTPIYADSALMIALVLALFSIIFGTRNIIASERHEGVVLAIAFEAIVKLVAFLAVGVFVIWFMFDGFVDLLSKAASTIDLTVLLAENEALSLSSWVSLTLLSMMAIICLPRQFQVTVVENVDERHLEKARWMFPLYLVAINLFVMPIAIAGLTLLESDVSADSYVITLPIMAESPTMAILVFIGGISAATGMVIVASIALCTMVCNDLVVPLLMALGILDREGQSDLTETLKLIRRIAIVLIMLLGYLYVRLIGDSYALVTIGLVSFVAAAQFMPVMVGGMYWRRGNWHGAVLGLSAGFLVWLYTLLLPSFAKSGWLPVSFLEEGIFGLEYLMPYSLFGLEGLSPISHSLLWSMLANIGGYILGSVLFRTNEYGRNQAHAYVDIFTNPAASMNSMAYGEILIRDLRELSTRYLGNPKVSLAFQSFANVKFDYQPAPPDLILTIEGMIAKVIGASSARIVIIAATKSSSMNMSDALDIIGEASSALESSHDTLSAAIENISQGITFFDSELKMVAWNQRFVELFNYPKELIYHDCPLELFFEYNAHRGEYGPGDPIEQVSERIGKAKLMEPHCIERILSDGRIIEIQGAPVPGSGFVTTYTDITRRKQAQKRLEGEKERAEMANRTKTEFLSNMSHELRTPLNAIIGFSEMITQEIFGPVENKTYKAYVDDIHTSGQFLLDIISDILDVAQIESGNITLEEKPVDASAVIESCIFLIHDRAHKGEVEVIHARTGRLPLLLVDERRFKQIILNLLSNAVKFCHKGGRVEIAATVDANGEFQLIVSDTGIGIAPGNFDKIFEPFGKVENCLVRKHEGIGLGLPIVKELVIAHGGFISLDSEIDKGSTFFIQFPASRSILKEKIA